MNARQVADEILQNDFIDFLELEETKCSKIEELISQYGWSIIQDILFDILLDKKRRIADYQVVAEVFWGAVLDKREISKNKVIALLIKKLPNDERSNENNLVWSIVSKLQNLSYLSKYNPLEDPEIIKEICRLGIE